MWKTKDLFIIIYLYLCHYYSFCMILQFYIRFKENAENKITAIHYMNMYIYVKNSEQFHCFECSDVYVTAHRF